MPCAALAFGCVAIDEVQTPNGDVDLGADEAEAAEEDGEPGAMGSTCAEQGWSFVRVAGRDQLPAWSAPDLTPSCGSAPHRLSASAPRLGSTLAFEVSSRSGQVVEATYATTGTGADGEAWGEYVAPIELTRASFAAAPMPDRQPFELTGTILGPFGPVPIALSGCARVRAPRC